jgi:phage baseplate assembly protein W
MAKSKYLYTDINFDFTNHPVKGDIVLSTDNVAVQRALKYLLYTSHYERPFHPEIGGNLNKMLFELASPLSQGYLKKEITNVIEAFEPRVSLIDVDVVVSELDMNALTVTIRYYLLNQTQPYELSFLLDRTR